MVCYKKFDLTTIIVVNHWSINIKWRIVPAFTYGGTEGANKLKKIIEKQKALKDSIAAANAKEWEETDDNELSKEVFAVFRTSEHPACSYSFTNERVQYGDCKPVSEFQQSDNSLIAAFTNGRLGNQVQIETLN